MQNGQQIVVNLPIQQLQQQKLLTLNMIPNINTHYTDQQYQTENKTQAQIINLLHLQ